MVFTTMLFTYFFFPAAVLLWLLGVLVDKRTKKTRAADMILIALSAAFFAWTDFSALWWLMLFAGAVYVFGLLIELANASGRRAVAKKALVSGVSMLILMLGYWKYGDFSIGILNSIFKTNLLIAKTVSILGISFITFTAVSYLTDIYKGKAKAGTIVDCALYLSFFPKLVSGPIVLWRDFSAQIGGRTIKIERLYQGIKKISCGYAKKLILADTFGKVISAIGTNYIMQGIDAPTAWISVMLFWLQMYYDFSGYSDIAIGLAKIFGFDFFENFNFPYVSSSVSEFWRRWHISLGSWFREYVYIPLGGSRRGRLRTLANLAVVFILTGIWHGAGYHYLLWGVLNGGMVIFERVIKDNRVSKRIPVCVKWAGTTAITIASWQLFRFSSFWDAYSFFRLMLGSHQPLSITFTWLYYCNLSTVVFAAVGILGATVPGIKSVQAALGRQNNKTWFETLKGTLCIMLFILSIFFMINSTYSPFIYFQY